MSTITKLYPQVRRDRTARANLLRNPPRHANPRILAELSLIAKSSKLTGATKQVLFERGVHQIRRLALSRRLPVQSQNSQTNTSVKP